MHGPRARGSAGRMFSWTGAGLPPCARRGFPGRRSRTSSESEKAPCTARLRHPPKSPRAASRQTLSLQRPIELLSVRQIQVIVADELVHFSFFAAPLLTSLQISFSAVG